MMFYYFFKFSQYYKKCQKVVAFYVAFKYFNNSTTVAPLTDNNVTYTIVQMTVPFSKEAILLFRCKDYARNFVYNCGQPGCSFSIFPFFATKVIFKILRLVL
jgi:hypothetical protein